ncbi:hypothetical protein GCM10010431_81160 [Streptomyces kunmingensis]
MPAPAPSTGLTSAQPRSIGFTVADGTAFGGFGREGPGVQSVRCATVGGHETEPIGKSVGSLGTGRCPHHARSRLRVVENRIVCLEKSRDAVIDYLRRTGHADLLTPA